jgi:hypothetical protein
MPARSTNAVPRRVRVVQLAAQPVRQPPSSPSPAPAPRRRAKTSPAAPPAALTSIDTRLARARLLGHRPPGPAARLQRDEYTPRGFPIYQETTAKHDRNWQVYVDTQYRVIYNELTQAGYPGPGVDQHFSASYKEASQKAAILDRLSSVGEPTIDPTQVDPQSLQRLATGELAAIINDWRDTANHNLAQKGQWGTRLGESLPPTWGPLVTGGMGSWVHAVYTARTTHATGSAASGTTTAMPWEDDHLTHRGYDHSSNKTIYVRGHLLNDHLGGPSAPYNLVPLTGEETRSSANANKVHEGSVENMAKAAVQELYGKRDEWPPKSPSKNDLERVEYGVDAEWGGHHRPDTQVVRQAAGSFADLLVQLRQLGEDTAQLTVDDVRRRIPTNEYEAWWTGELKEGVDAVVPYGERGSVAAEAAAKGMAWNADLWEYEDKVVPTRLIARLAFWTADGKDFKEQEIDNSLPSEPRTPCVKLPLLKLQPKPKAKKKVGSTVAFTPTGLPLYTEKTKGHKGNWKSYVDAQFQVVSDELLRAGYPLQGIKSVSAPWYGRALQQVDFLDRLSVSPDPVADPYNTDPKSLIRGETVLLAQAINGWRAVASSYLGQANARPSRLGESNPPTWGPLVTGGMGSWVRARFTAETTHAAGSAASGTKTALPWQDDRLTHRGYDHSSAKTIYVRGHLLNDHLGGPSAPYNLVPLTGTETRSSANANKVHEGSIENMAKASVQELYQKRDQTVPGSPSQYDLVAVDYFVDAVWAGGQRKGTLEVADGAQAVRELAESIQTHHHLAPSQYTVEALRTSIDPKIYAQLWMERIKEPMDAVVPFGKRDAVNVLQALQLMLRNAELWKYEDAVVPKKLVAKLVRSLTSGEQDENAQEIDNSLPGEARTPYVKSGIG